LLGALAGLLIPLTMQRMGRDPAIGSVFCSPPSPMRRLLYFPWPGDDLSDVIKKFSHAACMYHALCAIGPALPTASAEE
jgi:hypothetical protein